MFGFHMILSPVDPKENGYQNPHLLCLMQVWALTCFERYGALVEDACGVKWTHPIDASL